VSSILNAQSAAVASGEAHAKRPVRRVLHVFHSLGMGGAETWLVALLEWLRQYGSSLPVDVQVEVCLTCGERTLLDDRVASLGARLHYVRYRGKHLVRFRREFTKLLASGRYDAIHDHADYAGGVHLLCGLGELPRARVVHLHNPLATFNGSLAKKLARAVGRQGVKRLATTVAGTSMRLLQEYDLAAEVGVQQRRMALHCGFNLTPFATNAATARPGVREEFQWSVTDQILLFVGRLESHFNQKNPLFALDIARACIARNPGVKALFVGAGDEARRTIESKLNEEGLGDAIRMLGIRFDVPRLMVASDLLLFPSLAEGLGMVAVEAQAAGLRVLASDTTPGECAVVSGMVTFASLNEPPVQWAKMAMELLDLMPVDRYAAHEAVARSPFSISSSAMALMDVYGFIPASE
jgi:glycosyltransferase involved in cell wall biosynthesis